MSGSGLGLQTSEEVGNSRKRKHEMNGDEDAASVSTNFSGNSDCYAGWSSEDLLREITRLKAKLYDRDVRIKKLKKRKSAWVKEKGLLEHLCRKQASSLEKHMNASVINLNDTGISKLESCKTSDKIAAFAEVGQDTLRHRENVSPNDGANNVQFAAPVDAENATKKAQEVIHTTLTNEKAALQQELSDVRTELAAASVLIATHRINTEEMSSQHEAALAHATLAAKEAHSAALRSDREQIAKLQAFLQEQQGTIARLQRERADAAAEVVRLQAALTVSRVRAEDCVCQIAGAVSGARSSTQEEQQSLPLENLSAGDMDPCVGLAELRGQELSTSLFPENPQLAGIAATDTVTEMSLLQERLARIQRVLAAKTWAVNDLLRRQNEAELGMAKTLQIERASFKLQLNSVLVQVAALQREVQDRDVQIQGLVDNFGTRTQPSCTAICDVSLPPEYSAQLADLQAQVWELRSALQSRAARVTELEQQCTLSTTERALYEMLRLAFVKQGAELQGIQQQRQGYARIIGAAVTVLKREYADVFVPCAEIAGERYPYAQGAEADYYTLAVYGYRARGQPSGNLQGDACPTLGTSGGADAAHYTASSDDTQTLLSGDLLRDTSRAHYSRESVLAVPSTVTGAAIVDLSDDAQMLLESNGLSAHGP